MNYDLEKRSFYHIWSYANNSGTKHNRDVELHPMDRSKTFQLYEVMSDDLDLEGQGQVKVKVFKKIAIWSYVNNFVSKHNRDVELQPMDRSKPFLLLDLDV